MRNIRTEERARLQAINRAKREAEKAIAAERRAREKFARNTAGSMVGSAGGMFSRGGQLAGGAFAGVVGLGLAEELRVRRSATGLANQAFGNGGDKRTREQIKDSVLTRAGNLSKRTGVDREELIGGLRSYTGISGDLKGGEELLEFMTGLAKATDASLEDIGTTTAKIKAAIEAGGATGDEAVRQTKETMAAIAGQTKVGSVELKDLASQIGKVTSAAGRFKGGAPELIKSFGALTQLAIQGGAPSAEEAATAVSRIPSDIVKHQKALGKMGVNVFADAGKTQLRDPLEILKETLLKSKGDLTKLSPIFGEQSIKAFNPLSKAFQEAGGGVDGLKAVDKLLAPLLKAQMSEKEINDSANASYAEPGAKFAAAFSDLKQTIGKEVLPVLTNDLIPAFAQLVPMLKNATSAVSRFVEWFAQNPTTGIGVLVGGAIVKDLASAGIGAAARAGIEKGIGVIGKGGMSIATAALAVELATITVAKENVEKEVEKVKDDVNAARKVLMDPNADPVVKQAAIDKIRDTKDDANTLNVATKTAKNNPWATGLGILATGGLLAPAILGMSYHDSGRQSAESEAKYLEQTSRDPNYFQNEGPSGAAPVEISPLAGVDAASNKLNDAATKLDSAAGKLNAGNGQRPSGI